MNGNMRTALTTFTLSLSAGLLMTAMVTPSSADRYDLRSKGGFDRNSGSYGDEGSAKHKEGGYRSDYHRYDDDRDRERRGSRYSRYERDYDRDYERERRSDYRGARSESDRKLEQKLTRSLKRNPFVDSDDVHIRVSDGVVVLSGIVDTPQEAEDLVELAYDRGARKVIDRLDTRAEGAQPGEYSTTFPPYGTSSDSGSFDYFRY